MKLLLALLMLSAAVSVIFTSAVVLAQGPAPAPAIVTRPGAAGKARAVPDVAPPPQAVEVKQVMVKNAFGVRAGNLDNVTQQFKQFTNQAQPAVRAELIFVRRICGLDRESFRRVHQGAQAALKNVATKFAESQQARLPGPLAKGANPPSRIVDGAAVLQQELESTLKKNLSPDQFASYRAEVEKRTANRRQTAVRYLVDAIDQDLYLSDEQRQKLTETLSSHWDDHWNVILEHRLTGGQFQPLGVGPIVTPYLNEVQAKVWQGMQRVQEKHEQSGQGQPGKGRRQRGGAQEIAGSPVSVERVLLAL
jgi:hypothetical protein